MSERLRVEVRFKNAVLYNALHDKFPPSRPRQKHADFRVAEKAIGVSYSDILQYLSLTRTPWNCDGTPRKGAEALSLHLGIDCDELFPHRLYSGVMPKSLVAEIDGSRYISLCEARKQKLLPRSTDELPMVDFDKKSASEIIGQVLNTLPPREQLVIKLRFGMQDGSEHTLAEVAEKTGTTRERISCIEKRALTHLRHPSRSRHLRSFLGEINA